MRESVWTAKMCNDLERLGCKVFAVVGGTMQQPGMPDRWISHITIGGVWLEFKVKAPLSRLQRFHIRDIKARGSHAFVIRYPDLIQDEEGNEQGRFTDARSLLAVLKPLVQN